MTILDRIRSLANDRKVTLAELERSLDFSNGSLRKWETSTPSGDKIEKVADYFNVSVDYLLGRTKNPYASNEDLMNTQELETFKNAITYIYIKFLYIIKSLHFQL